MCKSTVRTNYDNTIIDTGLVSYCRIGAITLGDENMRPTANIQPFLPRLAGRKKIRMDGKMLVVGNDDTAYNVVVRGCSVKCIDGDLQHGHISHPSARYSYSGQ